MGIKIKSLPIQEKIAFIVSIVTVISMFFSFSYLDLVTISKWSVEFTEILMSGKIYHFYEYIDCMGNFLWLLPMAIWNIPIWLLYHIGMIEVVETPIVLMWLKLFYLLAMFILWLGIVRIMEWAEGTVCELKRKMMVFILLFSSVEILTSTLYAGQDEIVYMSISIWALYAWLKEKNKWFLLLSVISVTICPIMLLQVVLLLCYRYKSVFKILAGTVLCYLPTVFFEIVYNGSESYQLIKQNPQYCGGMAFLESMLKESYIRIGENALSPALAIIVIVFFHAYVSKEKGEKREQLIHILVLLTVVMGTESFLMYNNFYRLCIYIPYLVLLIIMGNNKEMSFFLFALLNLGRYFVTLFVNRWQNMHFNFMMDNKITQHIKKISWNLPEFRKKLIDFYVVRDTLVDSMDTIVITLCIILFALIVYSARRKKTFEMDKIIAVENSLLLYSLTMFLAVLLFFVTRIIAIQ